MSDDGTSVVAIQRWSSSDAHRAAVSADDYAGWWAAYEPCLETWDRLVDLVEEWSGVEVDLGDTPGPRDAERGASIP